MRVPMLAENGSGARSTKILVVDDDRQLLDLLDVGLRRSGYEVWTSVSAQEGLDTIRRRGLPHLAIVDIMMPGQDGFDFCKRVHAFSDLPVIVLTAVTNHGTLTRAIEECAEDCVTKPFHFPELIARVERVLRRIGDFSYAALPVIEVDERLSVDLPGQRAIVAGEPVGLTPTESRLLHILMVNAGRVITADHLRDRLWPFGGGSEASLRVHVHRLRKKIEPDPDRPCYILTEHGLGYRFSPRC
jgi:DNA-binding response OmpR family regulator